MMRALGLYSVGLPTKRLSLGGSCDLVDPSIIHHPRTSLSQPLASQTDTKRATTHGWKLSHLSTSCQLCSLTVL